VVSAVEGVQAQTRVLMRTLQRLEIPTLIFVNKIDRRGARTDGLLGDLATKLTPAIVPMVSVRHLGSREAGCTPYGVGDGDFIARLAEVVADADDRHLATYVNGGPVPDGGLLRGELAKLSKDARAHPVYFGSALTGAGVEAVTAGIVEFLPARQADSDASPAGTVFKVERGSAGEKVAFVRMYEGTVRIRDRLAFGGRHEDRVTSISGFDRHEPVRGAAPRRPRTDNNPLDRKAYLLLVRP
jgi:ribosomal protection tetracycline resistance protein